MTNAVGSIVFILCLIGCELSREIDTIPHTPQIVLDKIQNADSSFKIALYQSVPLNENILWNRPLLELSSVSIYEDGVLLETLLPALDHDNFHYSSTGIMPQKDKLYTIEVVAEGYQTAVVSAKIPDEILISDFYFSDQPLELQKAVNSDPDQAFQAWVRFDDPDLTSMNYYLLDIFFGEGSNYQYTGQENEVILSDLIIRDPEPLSFLRENLNFEILGEGRSQFYNYLSFDDNALEQENRQLTFYSKYNFKHYISIQQNPPIEYLNDTLNFFTLRLRHVTEDQYNYLKSREYQVAIQNDPFSEPFFIEGNVQGGLGNYTFFTESTVVFKDIRDTN